MASVWGEVDQVDTRLLIRVRGELSVATAPRVRELLLKSLVDEPDALVVDLSELAVREAVACAVFSAVARQASVWPGTPLLLCAGPEVARLFADGGFGRLPVFASTAEALASSWRNQLPALSDTLIPVSGAARRARDLATEACARWDLPELTAPAAMIAGELVTNAMEHAQTMADLRFSLGRRYLMIAVRDGSKELPRLDAGPLTDPERGRGLLLVDALAQRWGSIPAEGGKVVWASLSLSAPGMSEPGA